MMDNIGVMKKFAYFPVKERLNIYGEGGWIWLRHYYEWIIPGCGRFREKCTETNAYLEEN